MIDQWDLCQINQSHARGGHYEVAVLPVGSIEPHNFHLPYGTDFLAADEIVRRICSAAWPRCQSVLRLPALPYGVNANVVGFPLIMHIPQAVLDAMVREVFTSLHRSGIRKFVLVNGHGGNEFLPLVRQLQTDLACHIFLVDWWQAVADKYGEIFDRPDNHAGQMETSIALELFPQLVEMERALDGSYKDFRFEALRAGYVRVARLFARMAPQCAVGNPQGASAQRGRRALEIIVGRLADFLVELANTPIDESFPFTPEEKKD